MTEYIEIDFELIHETQDAILITDGDKEGWVPKSCIEDGQDFDYESETELNMAEWFAAEEGWI